MTSLDGYQMALQGRAGPALSIAAVGSFVAGTFSVILLTLLAPPADVALSFGPPEYLLLMLLGLATLSVLLAENKVKGMLAALLGVMIGLIGLDVITALPRFTFGKLELLDGIGFLAVAVGLFGIGEVLVSLEQYYKVQPIKTSLRDLLLSKRDMRDSAAPIVLALVLGPMMETNLRQALLMSQGSFAIFFTRPISAALAVLIVVFVFAPVLLGMLNKKPLPVAEEL